MRAHWDGTLLQKASVAFDGILPPIPPEPGAAISGAPKMRRGSSIKAGRVTDGIGELPLLPGKSPVRQSTLNAG